MVLRNEENSECVEI
ncbi:hypothetical protein YPPY63_1036, partial [Yersinia pestis PY-63]